MASAWGGLSPSPSHDYSEYETPSKQYENGPITYFEVITGLPRPYTLTFWRATGPCATSPQTPPFPPPRGCDGRPPLYPTAFPKTQRCYRGGGGGGEHQDSTFPSNNGAAASAGHHHAAVEPSPLPPRSKHSKRVPGVALANGHS